MSLEPTRPLSARRLIFSLVASLVLAVLIVLGAILPAEFNRDPLGRAGSGLPFAGPLAFRSGWMTNCSWQATHTS